MPSGGRAPGRVRQGLSSLPLPTEPPLLCATLWAELRATEPQSSGARLMVPGPRTCHLQSSEHFCLCLV